MKQNSRFYVTKKYGFSQNDNIIHDLYSPIIGNQASMLYFNLLREADRQAHAMNSATLISDYLKTIDLNIDCFINSRKKLEAIGLIDTFAEQDINTNLFTIVLKEPLNFKDFISNQKYRHLLIHAIGQRNYDKIEFLHNSSRVKSGSINISAPFESVFNDEKTIEVALVNFEELHKRIAKNSSTPIVINQQCKHLIESYWKSYDLSMSEIESIVYNSVLLVDNRDFETDVGLMNIQFQKYINSFSNIDVLKNIKVNRDHKIFINYCKKEETEKIFSDYMTLNCYHYLQAIIKTKLSDTQITILDTLKNKYLISDFIVNMLVDYSLFKTHGVLNEKYIYKVANSINTNNLKTLQEIYDYFHFRSKKTQEQKNQSTNDGLLTWEEVN